MSITTYKGYFRTLAIQNKKLRHEPSSESPEAPAGGCHFTFFSQQDVVNNALRTKIGEGPCLHLHLPDMSLSDNKAFALRGNYDAGFIVSQKAQLNNLAQMEAAYANTEAIIDELIAKMLTDYYNSSPKHCDFPLGTLDFNKLQVTPVGPIWTDRYGWFVSFPYTLKKAGTRAELAAIVANAFLSDQIFESQFESAFE